MTGAPQRLRGAWRGIDSDQRFAAGAAAALLLTMFLPWYEKSFGVPGRRTFAKDSISAFGAVSFVEAAIFLVSAGVLALLLTRAEGGRFQLPGGDGTVILAAGLWAAALIFYRVFDRPEASGQAGTVGVQWGFFVAFVAAGALALAGQRIRVASRAQPPLRSQAPPAASSQRRTDVASASGEEARTEVVPVSGDEAVTNVVPRRRRPSSRAVTREDAEQLTFDEAPEPPPLRPGEIPPERDRR
ncbi:MAG: hypothetical protein M3401_09775 [Actinomycetota bacterium]|nr:hypothetical protein [Actinomycetota bacterium]